MSLLVVGSMAFDALEVELERPEQDAVAVVDRDEAVGQAVLAQGIARGGVALDQVPALLAVPLVHVHQHVVGLAADGYPDSEMPCALR